VTSTTSEPAGTARPGGTAQSAGLSFRLAGTPDWPLIWPFWHQIVAAGDTYCYDPRMGYDAGRQLWFGTPPDQVWLATLPDEGASDGADQPTVLGSYRIGPNKAGPGSHIGTASYMVSAAARGRGVGRAMVLHCLEQAGAAGYRGLQFNAVAASNESAVRLYLDLGFTVIGTVPGGFCHPEQGFVDLLIMFHPL
jgi:GNAT superfamily N-acetyltransferase